MPRFNKELRPLFLLAVRVSAHWLETVKHCLQLFSDIHSEHEKTHISLSHLRTEIVYSGRKCECTTPASTDPPIRNTKIYFSALILKLKLYGIPRIRVLTEETGDVLSIRVHQNVWLWESVPWYSGLITAGLRGSEARQIACPGRQPKGRSDFTMSFIRSLKKSWMCFYHHLNIE